MSGLFATFNIAKSGMFAQQKAIDVTSHNIANANTVGYSRQRATIETTRPMGMPSMNNSIGPGQIGTGAEVASVSRVRDAFLDYQIRSENSTKGCYEGREKFLSEIESIMNEPADTGISNLIGKFYDAWQQLSKSPESSNARTVVAQQSKTLAVELNQTYKQLEQLKANTQDVIKQTVVDINSMLNQINKLNQEIIGVKVGDSEPNDLMDKRDLLVDELSSKFGIQIDKKMFYGEDLKPVDGANLGNSYLVKSNPNDKVMRFSYVSSIVESKTTPGKYNVTYYKNGDMSTEKNAVNITMTLTPEQYKELDEGRVLWAEQDGTAINVDGSKLEEGTEVADFKQVAAFKPSSGELKGYMSVQEDVDKNMEQLNKLAKAIAFSVNAIHTGNSETKPDDLLFFVNGEDSTENSITAKNISVNEEILLDVMRINAGKEPKKKDDTVDASGATDGSRALAIAVLRDRLINIQSMGDTVNTRQDMFTKGGTSFESDGMTLQNASSGMKIDGYFKDIINRLGIQTQEAKRIVQNQGNLLYSLEESRNSVSGVSQDEEMANLIQFQHAYSANAKVISTVDELLDVVVNGLKK